MKYLIVGDLHIYGKNPPCRKDNLVEAQFQKLEEIVSVAKKYRAKIIQVGDIFESPNISYGLWRKTAEILRNVVVVFVYGNHDLLWHSLDTALDTATGALTILPNFRTPNVHDFSYLHWGSDKIEGEEKTNILISHKAIIPNHMVNKWMTTSKDEYIIFSNSLQKFDWIFCGHYHKPYVVGEGQTTIINPGVVCRRRAIEEEIAHVPSVVIIDFVREDFDMIPLKTARLAEEVMSEDHLELGRIKKITRYNAENFLRKLKTLHGLSEKSPAQFLSRLLEVLKDKEMEKGVEEILMSTMEEVFGNRIDKDLIMTPKKRIKQWELKKTLQNRKEE